VIAEVDESKPKVAGYLIGNEYGGKGTIEVNKLLEKGVMPWTSCSFSEALDKVRTFETQRRKAAFSL
jgi:hypothetical protein